MNSNYEGNTRISVKAIIIHQGKILLIRYKSDTDEWYTLPGGGQLFGETIGQTMIRECLEETGYHIIPGNLVFVRDYIGANHEFAEFDMEVHQVELMFLASIKFHELDQDNIGLNVDKDQIDIRWVELSDLEMTPLYPCAIRSLIAKRNFNLNSPVYLGDIN